MNLENKIEAVLFYKAEPMSKVELGRFFGVSVEVIDEALAKLKERVGNTAQRVLESADEVSLVTAPEYAEIIDALRKDEMKREIGKAGAETLAIILYRKVVSRADIDFIRGVNSSFILRNLLIRGLIKRIPHPSDKRTFQYQVTPELLKHLGVERTEALPEYDRVMTEIEKYKREQEEKVEI